MKMSKGRGVGGDDEICKYRMPVWFRCAELDLILRSMLQIDKIMRNHQVNSLYQYTITLKLNSLGVCIRIY